MPRNLLLAIGLLSLCGAAFTGASWWIGLEPAAKTALMGQCLVSWFCCGGPLAGGVVGWQVNQWRRNGWRRSSRLEDL